MVSTSSIAATAALLGDPARVAMLHALMDGRALTAAELARVAGISPPTASGHLAQLTASGLLAMAKQGRHRYHRLASPRVAGLIESLMQLAAETRPAAIRAPITGPRDASLRLARLCYDHVAGKLGVALADALTGRGFIELSDDAGLVTDRGVEFLTGLGIEAGSAPVAPAKRSRPFCRPCLDWSERRPHLAGRLGAALCSHCLAAGWVRRRPASRALEITPAGHRAFSEVFGASLA